MCYYRNVSVLTGFGWWCLMIFRSYCKMLSIHVLLITTNYSVYMSAKIGLMKTTLGLSWFEPFKSYDPDARLITSLSANSLQFSFLWVTMLKLEVTHDHRWKRQRPFSEELFLLSQQGFSFSFPSCQIVSWSSADLQRCRFQPLLLFDSSETPDFVLVMAKKIMIHQDVFKMTVLPLE